MIRKHPDHLYIFHWIRKCLLEWNITFLFSDLRIYLNILVWTVKIPRQKESTQSFKDICNRAPLLFFFQTERKKKTDQLIKLGFPRKTAPKTTVRRLRSYLPLTMLKFYIHNFQFCVRGKIIWYFPLSVSPSLQCQTRRKTKPPYPLTLSTKNLAYRPYPLVFISTIAVILINDCTCIYIQTKI